MTGFSKRLARTLPDTPRWVETRSLLLSGRGEVLGLEEESLSFVVRGADFCPVYASVVGHPVRKVIAEAAGHGYKGDEILAVPENHSYVAASLCGWGCVTAILHTLGDKPRLPNVPENSVRLLPSLEALDSESLPPELSAELEEAVSPIAVAFAGEHPVSFCYAAAQTESLWDVSIDTLKDYRRQGHAARCATYMIGHMARRGKRPVWGAEETNPPSLRLAKKLGFVLVDELLVFHPLVGAG